MTDTEHITHNNTTQTYESYTQHNNTYITTFTIANQQTTFRRDSLRGSSVKIGTIQRRLAWPMRKDDTHRSRSVNNKQLFADGVAQAARYPRKQSKHMTRRTTRTTNKPNKHISTQYIYIYTYVYLSLSLSVNNMYI